MLVASYFQPFSFTDTRKTVSGVLMCRRHRVWGSEAVRVRSGPHTVTVSGADGAEGAVHAAAGHTGRAG